MVCSILHICKIWQKGPSMNHRGPHQFCVLLTNRKLGEGRRKGEEEEGRKKMREGKGRGPPASPRKLFLLLFHSSGHIHSHVQPSCLSCS